MGDAGAAVLLALGAVAAGFVFAGNFIGHHYKEFWAGSLFEGTHNHICTRCTRSPTGSAGRRSSRCWPASRSPTSSTSPRRRCRPRPPSAFRPLYLFLLNKWYFDELYDFIFVRPAFWIGRLLWKGGDGAIIDGSHRRHRRPRAWTTGASSSCRPATSTTTPSPC